jgi:hypothetical protein
MGSKMTKLTFLGSDRRELLDILIEAAEVTRIEGRRPEIVVDGKTYAPHDLVKVAALLPDEPMLPHHQEKIDRMFQRKQYGYRGTANNLAHKINSIRSPADKGATIAARQVQARAELAEAPFGDRGFSDRTHQDPDRTWR